LFPSLDADQQRREKLRKELARCEKEFKLSKSAMQTNSKMNSKFFVNSLQKVRFLFCSLKAGVCQTHHRCSQTWAAALGSFESANFEHVCSSGHSTLSQLPANKKQPLWTTLKSILAALHSLARDSNRGLQAIVGWPGLCFCL
jgi:hypothetical protein